MPIFSLLRQVLAVAGIVSRKSVLAAAIAVAFLASMGASSDAVAESNKRRTDGDRRYYSPPRLPSMTSSRDYNNSKPQGRRFDNDDDDRGGFKSEPTVTDRRRRDDDKYDRDDRDDRNDRDGRNDDRDDQDRDDRNRRDGDGDSSRANLNNGVPSTVADLVKQWFASPEKKTPSVNPGHRNSTKAERSDPIPKIASKPSEPTKPLKKLTGRHVSDLSLKMPDMPANDILVRNLGPATLSKALARGMTVESRRDLGVLGSSLTRLVIPPGMKAAEARALLRQTDPKTVVDLNQRYRLHPSARDRDASAARRVANEPARATGGCASDRCYGATTIGWREQLSVCAKGLRIGVIDTGIDSTHPSLAQHADRIKFGRFGPGYRGARSDSHGTGVLALLAGNPKSSTPGLIPGARFYVADIFFADENGLPVSTTLHLLEALEWMDRLRVQIINLSLSGPRDDLVQAAIGRMSKPRTVDGVKRAGVVFVAAAGNGGPGAPPSYPAAYPEALAVTAVGKDLRGYRRANHGEYIDVAAPGVDIWTALPDGRQGYQTGTSFATPYMTAVVASLYRTLPGQGIKQAILERVSVHDLGAPGRDRIYGRGLVQAPEGCGPSKPWSPTVISRARPGAQVTASR